ncbi:MAG: aminopeptidase [Lachnospiraceae bacterium]|nr:aminopeptidase [Lachnospiraceae bacterium]
MTVMEERYELAVARISQIMDEQEVDEKFQPYFCENAGYLAIMAEEYEWIASGKMKAAELMELQRHNEICFIDLVGRNYDTSFSNPAWAVKMLGEEFGQILSAVAAELHSLPAFVYEQNLEAITIRMELFLEIYGAFSYAWKEENMLPAVSDIREMIYWFASDYMELVAEAAIADTVDWERNFAVRIVEESDLEDLSYLFYYGEYITDNQWKLAEHLNSLPEEKIKLIADTYTEGFRKGFEVAKKPLEKKKSVNIRYPLGFERVIRQAILNFREMGLEPVIYRAPSSFLAGRKVSKSGYFGAAVNKQFDYDHENDQALYLDKKFVNHKLECRRNAWEAYKEKAALHAGPAVVECFGEIPFEPANKPEKLALSKEQQKLSVEYLSQSGAMSTEYIDPEERSFTIIAFPVPEIGEDFPAIFDEILKINTLDYKKYETIQQSIIDTLDKASWVRVKGCGENRTDLSVMLHKLNDPAKETNFENCVADVNIPVGEVFTSPVLAGTKGTLHVTEVYLNDLKYRDLELTFQDGMITDYRCSNFENEEENRKLVQDNVLFHHETLPIGEFAIGTNTTAYVAARRFDINDKLPILIAEKMGPHFAVGDTCYSHEEDRMTYNPDGKAIIARDNEVSALRHEDIGKAYLNCHTDITISYDELGELTAVAEDGTEYVIIRDGRFVLDGTEELNMPFYGASGG